MSDYLQQMSDDLDGRIKLLEQVKGKLIRLKQLQKEVQLLSEAECWRLRAEQDLTIISGIVCEQYKISFEELCSRRRDERSCLPRHVVFYLAKEMTDCSLKRIGEFVGHRDHGTVIHGIKTISNRVDVEPGLREDVRNARSICEQRLKNGNGAANDQVFQG